MERQEAKRATPPKGGKRVKKRGRSALIVIVLILVLLAAAYAALCVYVARSETLLPNTSAAGIDLSGLTRQEAMDKLEREMGGRYAALSVSFICGGTEFNVPGSELSADLSGAVAAAWDAGSGGLLTGGVRYLSALLSGVDVEVPLTFPQEPSAIAQAESHITNAMVETSYTVDADTLTLTKGVTGQAIDTSTLEEELLERFQYLLSNDEPASYAPIEVPVITEAPPEPDFDAIHRQVYTEAADAYLDKESKEIIPSITGVNFDIAAARAMLERTEEGGVCSVPLDKTEPSITTAKLEANLFKDVLASSTTKCAGPKARWYNIDLAAGRVNGTILLPGETFSYNALCGPYDTSAGYQKAGAYVGGKSVDTTAGGICQLSSTIYWTTLKANLEIVERNQHRYNSGYMPVVGTDATVYGNSLDFRFKNNTEYPIKISCYQDSGHKLHVTIHGTDTTGIHGEPYSVTLGTVPFKNTYKPDASKVPVGGAPVRDPDYARYNGITVEVYQKLVDKNGKTVSTTKLYKNTYRSSDAVYYYNPADAARLGINPSTGLMTETPVTPTPVPSTTPTPSQPPVVTPTPSAPVTEPPAVTPTPDPAPTPAPTPAPDPVPAPTVDQPILPPEAVENA